MTVGEAATEAPPPSPAAAASHQLSILCAEDYPTNQLIIRTLLEDLGHLVEIVGDGRAALRALAERDYDLVLMDGRMPVMDGLEATRLLREGGLPSAPARDRCIRVVALTANVTQADRERFVAAGVDGFLGKPIDERELHEALAAAIAARHAAGARLRPLTRCGTAELRVLLGESPADDAPAPATHAGFATAMRRAFVESLPERLAELDAASAAGDAPTLARLLHGIKGSAGYVKDAALAQLAARLEQLADAGRLDDVRQAFPSLHAAVQPYRDGAHHAGDGH
jgi:CheY-like chemotaxis protein/HPt (histidine-containing phosphotransfer) domain-containing protein